MNLNPKSWNYFNTYVQWLLDNYSYSISSLLIYLPQYKRFLQQKYKKSTIYQKLYHIRKCILYILYNE